jgi:hypothetical protein
MVVPTEDDPDYKLLRLRMDQKGQLGCGVLRIAI